MFRYFQCVVLDVCSETLRACAGADEVRTAAGRAARPRPRGAAAAAPHEPHGRLQRAGAAGRPRKLLSLEVTEGFRACLSKIIHFVPPPIPTGSPSVGASAGIELDVWVTVWTSVSA